jgi:protein-disulfide isomerase
MMTSFRFAARLTSALVIGMFSIGIAPACAQKPDDVAAMKKDIEALKAGQDQLRKDIEELKALLKPGPESAIMAAPPGMTAPIADAPVRGAAAAQVIMLEFSDYECPFCGRFVRDTFPAIDQEYIQTGKVKHLFRAFPLESIHKNAFKAHEAAMCAGAQGKYWALHSQLFGNQKALGQADLSKYAQAAGLDTAAFEACLASGKMAPRVQADIEFGNKLGISGTPLFLIGKPGPNGEMTVLKGISGAQPFSVFKKAIDDVIAGK